MTQDEDVRLIAQMAVTIFSMPDFPNSAYNVVQDAIIILAEARKAVAAAHEEEATQLNKPSVVENFSNDALVQAFFDEGLNYYNGDRSLQNFEKYRREILDRMDKIDKAALIEQIAQLKTALIEILPMANCDGYDSYYDEGDVPCLDRAYALSGIERPVGLREKEKKLADALAEMRKARLREREEEPEAPAPTVSFFWRHKKRGTLYGEIGTATLQANAGTMLSEGALLMIYQDTQGKVWAREISEFEDGRFEACPVTVALAGDLPSHQS